MHPSAIPREQGDAEIAVGGWLPLFGGVSALVAPVDRLTLGAQMMLTPCAICASAGSRAQLYGSLELTESDSLNVAPYVQLSVGTPLEDAISFCPFGCTQTRSPWEVLLLPGLALEGGSQKLRFDLSAAVPLWLDGTNDPPALDWLLAWSGEAGVRTIWGDDRQNSVRFAMTSLAPSIAYRREWKHVFVEAGLTTGVFLEVGAGS